jgi:predicted cupin superfamily sugar epimerase
MNAEAAHLIRKFGLVPLPGEGGFFARTWTGSASVADGRAAGSAILFLMTENDFSALHRLRCDEVWHFHAGDPAELVRLDPRTKACLISILGPDPEGGHVPQAIARAGEWQGARIVAAHPGAARGWTLVGCTMAPAWSEGEFELGKRKELEREFPAHSAIVRALTR